LEVELPTGKKIWVTHGHTVREIKDAIEDVSGIPSVQQKLLVNGQEVDDGTSLLFVDTP